MTELSRAAHAIWDLRRRQVTERAPWADAIAAFDAALGRCDDGAAIEAVLNADDQDDLPIDSKTRAFERRLALGPRTPEVLRAFADHLWLHGPEDDERAEALQAEADRLEEAAKA